MRKIILLMSLTICLSSSSFFLPRYLTQKIQQQDIEPQLLRYALKIKLPAAYQYKLDQAKLGSEQWLYYARHLAKNDSVTAINLAKYFLSNEQDERMIFWYKEASKLGSIKAAVLLAQYYFDKNQLVSAQQILAKHSYKTIPSVVLGIKIAIAQGDGDFISLYQHKLNESLEGRKILAKIQDYHVNEFFDNKRLNEKVNSNVQRSSIEGECLTSVQFFATTLHDLDKIVQLKKEFSDHKLSSYVCLSIPQYIPLTQLNCTHKLDQVIQCDEGQWLKLAKRINSRYIGVLLPKGGANVHLGIMYLDRADTYEVFTHEVSHLLGFIDEYPLAKNHAKCSRVQKEMLSHNIAILNKAYHGDREEVRQQVLAQIPWAEQINDTTPILQHVSDDKFTNANNWLLGTPNNYINEIGVFNSDSCNEDSFRAYKPLSKATSLMYYEKKFPEEYFTIFEHKPERFLMPSFHYNLALFLFNQGNYEQSKRYLEQSASYELNDVRNQKVIMGNY